MTDLRTAAQQALDDVIENARLLGATQAKKGFGCYSQEDANLEGACHKGIAKHSAALRAALAQQAEPLTIERLRYALVASRIIPPAAVEDPDGYDDGVTLFRIEALHRRIT